MHVRSCSAALRQLLAAARLACCGAPHGDVAHPVCPCAGTPDYRFPPVRCPQAVEYVQLQRDDDLWEQLIALTLGDAQLTGGLGRTLWSTAGGAARACFTSHRRSLRRATAGCLQAFFLLAVASIPAQTIPNSWQAPCWTMPAGTSTRCASCPPSRRTWRWTTCGGGWSRSSQTSGRRLGWAKGKGGGVEGKGPMEAD